MDSVLQGFPAVPSSLDAATTPVTLVQPDGSTLGAFSIDSALKKAEGPSCTLVLHTNMEVRGVMHVTRNVCIRSAPELPQRANLVFGSEASFELMHGCTHFALNHISVVVTVTSGRLIRSMEGVQRIVVQQCMIIDSSEQDNHKALLVMPQYGELHLHASSLRVSSSYMVSLRSWERGQPRSVAKARKGPRPAFGMHMLKSIGRVPEALQSADEGGPPQAEEASARTPPTHLTTRIRIHACRVKGKMYTRGRPAMLLCSTEDPPAAKEVLEVHITDSCIHWNDCLASCPWIGSRFKATNCTLRSNGALLRFSGQVHLHGCLLSAADAVSRDKPQHLCIQRCVVQCKHLAIVYPRSSMRIGRCVLRGYRTSDRGGVFKPMSHPFRFFRSRQAVACAIQVHHCCLEQRGPGRYVDVEQRPLLETRAVPFGEGQQLQAYFAELSELVDGFVGHDNTVVTIKLSEDCIRGMFSPLDPLAWQWHGQAYEREARCIAMIHNRRHLEQVLNGDVLTLILVHLRRLHGCAVLDTGPTCGATVREEKSWTFTDT